MAIFTGNFDDLPILAHLTVGPVPTYPTSDDFQRASMAAANDDGVITMDAAALVWHREAVRWRRGHGGVPLDLHAIAGATARVLYDRAVRS